MEASAGAAPSSASGTASGSKAPNPQNQGGNSASQTSQSQRQGGAAPPSSTVDQSKQTDKRESAPNHAQNSQQDGDPEWDFGQGRKFKRSKVIDEMRTATGRLSAEARRANEAEQRADAIANHLKTLGIDVEELSKDPKSAFDKASRAYLQREIERATADPREIAAKDAEEARKAAEARLAEYEAQQKQQQEQTQVSERADQYAGFIHQVLEQSGLPRNPKTIARMAEIMLAAARNKSQLHPNELAQRVAAQIFDEQSHHLSSFSGDGAAIVKWLGPENTEAVRRHILQEAESKFHNPNNKPQRTAEPRLLASKTHPNGYITYDEMVRMSKGKR